MNILSLLFSFYGRVSRGKFWLGTLIVFLIVLVVALAGGFIDAQMGYVEPDSMGPAGMVTMALLIVLAGIPGLALPVKRLHDRGNSGWWVLVSLIPLVGGIWYIVIGVLEGDPGPNKYGPSPLGELAVVA